MAYALVIICFALSMIFLDISGIGCPVLYITGVSCPGCGLTRACLKALRFDFASAFHYHPLFFCVPLALLIFMFRNKMPKSVFVGCYTVIIVLFAGVYMLRLFVIDNDVVVSDFSKSYIARCLTSLSGRHIIQ